MTARHEPDGWPVLESLRVELDPLPARPTAPDLARTYASGFAMWAQLWPVVVEALQWLRGAWYGVHHELAQLRGELAATRVELLEELRKKPPSMRPKVPSFSGFAPEQTLGGGTHLPAGQWESLQRQVADLAAGLDAAEEAKREADARAQGAADALAAVDKRWETRRNWGLAVLALVTAVAGLVGWMIRNGAAHP